jgi:hypothetical protein
VEIHLFPALPVSRISVKVHHCRKKYLGWVNSIHNCLKIGRSLRFFTQHFQDLFDWDSRHTEYRHHLATDDGSVFNMRLYTKAEAGFTIFSSATGVSVTLSPAGWTGKT